MTDIKAFTEIFSKIAYSKSETQVFDDYLDICICALSGQQYEEEYLAIIQKYSKEEAHLFCELFAHMVIIMDACGEGFADCLGEFFQNHITHGKHGQFFTPSHVTDFIAQITMDETTTGKTIMDPACGSGRMILSAGKINRGNHFFASDIDHRCARMCAINMCLNSLCGEVAWMDSLKWEHWGGYSVFYDATRMFVPTITKLGAKEGLIYNNGPFNSSETSKKAPSEATKIINMTQTKLDL